MPCPQRGDVTPIFFSHADWADFAEIPILLIKNNLHEVTNLLDKPICKICVICMR